MTEMIKTEPMDVTTFFEELGIEKENPGICTGTKWIDGSAGPLSSYSPADNQHIGTISQASWNDYQTVIHQAQAAFNIWKDVPAPVRGELVRQMGQELRRYKEPLGKIVSYEMGKIYQEGLGEVQEMIDICDFAVGQSRQLYGSTMKSERVHHRMYDQYHPLGVVGVISAFNFPVAVWAWNTMMALVCGDVVIWKPSSKVPLCAVAVHKIMAKVLQRHNYPEGLINLVVSSSKNIGDDFLADKRVPLISATGSTSLGRRVARIVGERLGKTILELGGNNAIIVSPKADLNLVLPATVFGAVGTAGQRCTSTRRMLIHESVYDEFVQRLKKAYQQISERIGHPLDPETLVGPMIDTGAVETFIKAQEQVKKQGGKIIFGGEICTGGPFHSGCYVIPALAEVQNGFPIVQDETFAPLLYLIKYKSLEEAIALHNDVPQGLSSAIFTRDLIEAETFLSSTGSDCGIANVNIGTSGAEIGGAFGGEKDTGGGRESGSDAWKAYMRRQTNTINYSNDLPLAQGIKFDL